MTKPISQPDQDEPLDPAVEAIRVKLVRLLMVSGGIMMLGFMAVLLAIVYKWNRKPTPEQAVVPTIAEQVSGTLSIPKGATIISTAANGNGLVLTIKLSNGTLLIQRHDSAGKITSTFSVIEE